MPPFSMASREQAFFSPAVNPALRGTDCVREACGVAPMRLRVSFLTSMVGIELLVLSVQFSGKRKRKKGRVSSEKRKSCYAAAKSRSRVARTAGLGRVSPLFNRWAISSRTIAQRSE